MTEQVASYRRILKSSSITGGASVISVLIALVRTKIVAVMLGPTGIGLAGLYGGLISAAAALAAMGIGTVGTRQIAAVAGKDDLQALALVRRAVLWGGFFLACAGALVVWALRGVLAVKLLDGAEHSAVVGWLALGVALSVAGAAQGALMQGMRRIADMARLSVYGALLNSVLGVALLWHLGQSGLVAYVLIGPLVSFLLGYWYLARLPKLVLGPIAMRDIAKQWRTLLRLGVPFMGAGLMGAMVHLWIRAEVGKTLGAESLGHFQAAWSISMQYIGFVLAAMAADYYPRLTSVIHDHKAAVRLVNEQTEIALILSAPVLIAMIGLTPWVIRLLYSSAFMPAAEVLRWQILGDVLKIASWPLGFVILAAGAGKTYFFAESLVLLLMGALIARLSATIGLQITGIAFFACYGIYLPLVYWLARRRIQFEWTSRVVTLFAVIFCSAVIVGLLSCIHTWGTVAAIAVSLAFAIYACGRLAHMSNLGGTVGRFAAFGQQWAKTFGRKNG